ncbi:MAG TPA: type II CAAX endopeptidase family protein [Phycisphaerae bacterium]|nr:type II CAAX endopeptidase family protein [Phycisphaerae bacterium]
MGLGLLFMWKLGVFSSIPLLRAPARYNTLTFIQPIVVLLVYFFSAIIFMLILQSVGHPAHAATTQPASDLPDMNELIADAAGHFIGLALIVYIAIISFTNGLDGIGISWRKLPRGLGIGILAFVLFMPLLFFTEVASSSLFSVLTNSNPPEHPILQVLQQQPSSSETALLVFSACVMAPVTEELFFRGLIQSWLCRVFSNARKKRAAQPVSAINWPGVHITLSPVVPADPEAPHPVDRWSAILVTATLFAAVHLTIAGGAIAWMAPLFLLGVGLGYVYERTGNIFTDITLHACFNMFGILMAMTSSGN